MSPPVESREHAVIDAFLQLLGSLVDDADVIEQLTTLTQVCVDLLGAAEAGVLLADTDGMLRVMGASSEKVSVLELFQIQNDEGPCRDCYASGAAIVVADLRLDATWPSFSPECVAAGFPSVCALPLRNKRTVLGSLNLFMATPGPLSVADVALAQALADVASIALTQDASTRRASVRENQLRHALESRVSIEQAKGMIAERAQVDMDEAFARLRSFARGTNQGLTEVAVGLVTRGSNIDAIIASRQPPPKSSP